jgi:signal transduction histidine kinase
VEVAIRSVGVVQARQLIGSARGPRPAEPDGLERADAAGRGLFRRLVPRSVAGALAAAALELGDLEIAAVALPEPACEHPPPCRRPGCPRVMRPAAVAGAASGPLRAAVLARAAAAPDGADVALRVVPIAFGGALMGVLVGGPRRRARGARGDPALERLAGWAGPALSAAADRGRAEELARRRERRRLVRALHDDLGQQLFSVRSEVRRVREGAAGAGAELRARIDRLEGAVEAAEAALRVTMTTLAPLPAAGGPLGAVLGEQAAAFTARTGVPAHVIVIGEPLPLGADASDLLARAAREGLRNVERHAGASEVIVTLRAEDASAELTVQDDGAGPPGDDPPGRLGLGLLREQAVRQGGGLRLSRNDDAGATLRIWLPVP